MARVAYLLERKGALTAADRADPGASKHVPAALLEEVFALNEELDDVRALRASGAPPATWQARLQEAAAPIEEKRAEHERQLEELSARWDAVADRTASDADRRDVLHALRDRVLERNYISNLLATIESEKNGSGLQTPGSGPNLDAAS